MGRRDVRDQTPAGGAAAGRRRRLDPAVRHAQLLDLAVAVFARRGLGEARHAEIAAEAGVSVSTVFVYFPTREALVTAVLEEVHRTLADISERIHTRDLPAPELLRAHIKAFLDFVATRPDLARVWLDWSTAIRDDVWPRYLELQDKVVGDIRRTIERGQADGSIRRRFDPADEALLMVGSAHMLAQMQFTGRELADVEKFVDTLVGALVG
jgi:TetR/AcrR family hemagglutinin/protease transcriptional regulator